MSVASVITEGYGTFGSVASIIPDGYLPGAAPPAAPQAEAVRVGGHPWLGFYETRGPHPWLSGLPEEVAAVIQILAIEQVEDLELPKRLQALQLKRELKAKAIEYHTRYFEALSLERELLIELEIGERLRAQFDDEEALLLIALAASI